MLGLRSLRSLRPRRENLYWVGFVKISAAFGGLDTGGRMLGWVREDLGRLRRPRFHWVRAALRAAFGRRAIFRKGCALMKAEKYDKAVEQFRKCSNNAQAKVMLDECNLKLIEDRKKRDAVIRANFAKAHAAEQRNGNADGPVMNGNAGNGNIH